MRAPGRGYGEGIGACVMRVDGECSVFKGEGFAPTIAGGLRIREDGSRLFPEGFGVGKGGAVVGEPEFPHSAGVCCQLGRFGEEHVFVFLSFGKHVVFAVHSFADEKVGVGGGLRYGGGGAGVGAVGEFDAAAGRSEHHARSVFLPVFLDAFPFLQPVPEAEGDVLPSGFLWVEFAGAGQGEAVAIAGNAVLHGEGVDVAFQEVHVFCFGLQLADAYGEGKVLGDAAQGADGSFRSCRPNDGEVFGASHVAHGKEESGQAADVVCMQMGDEDLVYRFEAEPGFLGCNLGAFPAVNQDSMPVIAHHEGGEPAVGERLSASGS